MPLHFGNFTNARTHPFARFCGPEEVVARSLWHEFGHIAKLFGSIYVFDLAVHFSAANGSPPRRERLYTESA